MSTVPPQSRPFDGQGRQWPARRPFSSPPATAEAAYWRARGLFRRLKQAAHRHGDRTIWRAAGFAYMANIALRPGRFAPAPLVIGRAYLSHFWRPEHAAEWIDIIAALLFWPFGLIGGALWFTLKNGSVIARRDGRSRIGQFADQLRVALASGLLPPWYYVFELHRPGHMARAGFYLTRGQTKHSAYSVFRATRRSETPLRDKERFAHFCAERGIAALSLLLAVHDRKLRGEVRSPDELPMTDLFVKPVRGRGGKGAERWDHMGGGTYRHTSGLELSAEQFLQRLRTKSLSQPFLVQERALNHPTMRDLSNGALSTIRMISCLDERNRPEIIGAVLRMAVGRNVTVDNVHAGGLAAAVDLGSGRLLQATEMGLDARLGWIDRHPDTAGLINGRVLPLWPELCELVLHAHSAFADRIVVGWDVAIMADRPRLVEGNAGPDVDLIQRPLRTAFGNGRFGELIAHHLKASRALAS